MPTTLRVISGMCRQDFGGITVLYLLDNDYSYTNKPVFRQCYLPKCK